MPGLPTPINATPAAPVDPNTLPRYRRRRARVVDFLLHQIHTAAAFDAALYLKINGLPHSGWSNGLLSFVSRTMLHGELWVIAAALVAMVGASGVRQQVIAVVAPLWLATLVVNYPFKRIFRRRRPFAHLVEAVVVGKHPADHSFPSGHTAGAFAGAWLLAPYLGNLTPLLFGYAALVGFSRVYLGFHYPSDVAIGALVGMGLAIGFLIVIYLLPLPG
jgi:undecaprenyl-diphosphatase